MKMKTLKWKWLRFLGRQPLCWLHTLN